jgi:tRNA U38,U39,U40 pseudouridine synthase TruA
VAHVDLVKAWPDDKVRDAVNAHLQMAGARIAILRPAVPDGFDARFSATGRHYLYRIVNRRASGARPGQSLVGAQASRCRRHARGGKSAARAA